MLGTYVFEYRRVASDPKIRLADLHDLQVASYEILDFHLRQHRSSYVSSKTSGVSAMLRDPNNILTTRLIPRSKDAATNPRGIPYAPFVDKVEDYVSSRAEVDGTMKSFQEMISCGCHPEAMYHGSRKCRKYQFMEVNTQRRAAGLKEKVPDIKKTLDMVQFLSSRKVRCKWCVGCESIF